MLRERFVKVSDFLVLLFRHDSIPKIFPKNSSTIEKKVHQKYTKNAQNAQCGIKCYIIEKIPHTGDTNSLERCE